MKKYAAEVLGTFILVYGGCAAIATNVVREDIVTHVGIALTWGLIVMAMVYAVGDVSGAHINPAVTLGFWAARRFSGREVLPYMIAQCLGAFAASGLLRLTFPSPVPLGVTLPLAGNWQQTFLLEVILTAILMFVVLCVSQGSKEKGIMAGAAVGAVISFEVLFAGPISGASMNPARSLAPAVVSGQLEYLWVYLVATCIGSLVGVVGWICVRPAQPTVMPVIQEPVATMPDQVSRV